MDVGFFRHVRAATGRDAKRCRDSCSTGLAVVAMLLVGTSLRWRREVQFSYVAALLPVMAGITWVLMRSLQTSPAYSPSGKIIGELLFDGYTLALGVFTLIRGLRAYRIGEANLGLLIVSALAISRFFFDSDLGFTTRGFGFILVGLGFLAGNILMFRRKVAA